VDLEQRDSLVRTAEAELQERLAALEQLTGELADQRLHLAEQWARLLEARQHWQQEHDTAATELEGLTLKLQDKEYTLGVREKKVVSGEHNLRQRLAEIIHLRHHLEGCQARLRTRVLDWEGDRDRLLSQVQFREELAERRLQAIDTLRSRWQERRRQDLERLKASIAAAEKQCEEYAVLRDEWRRRITNLQQQERNLAEKTLALEQYRLECIGQSPDPPAAEKQLGKLRRHWASLSASAERTIERQRKLLKAEFARLEEEHAGVRKQARELASLEAALVEAQTAWEEEQRLTKDKQEQIQQELNTLQTHRNVHENQVEQLRDEVEHVARLLLDENEHILLPLVQAA
jgi:chromosome segregation ATPase